MGSPVMTAIFISFLFWLFLCFQDCDCRLMVHTHLKFNTKCKRLKLELLYDAERKVAIVQYLYKSHENSHAFQLGLIAADVKLLYTSAMRLYVQMENLKTLKQQVIRCRFLVAIQRTAMHVDNLVAMLEDDVRRSQTRPDKGDYYGSLLRTRNVARMGKPQKTANKTALRASMRNISNNKKAQSWPKVPLRRGAAAAKQRRRPDNGGFGYDY